MDLTLPVHELVTLENLSAPLSSVQLFDAYKRVVLRRLNSSGFAGAQQISLSDAKKEGLTLSALAGGQRVLICFAEAAASPMAIQSLSVEQCDACDDYATDLDIFYASFFLSPEEKKLFLLGPVLIRRSRDWLSRSANVAQFLPVDVRAPGLALTPLFGGAALFKMQQLLVPHVLSHGKLPKFSVNGLFENRAQGISDFYALLGGSPPTHMMLVRRDDESRHLNFIRPFFFYSDTPDSVLTLTASQFPKNAPESGLVELTTLTGTKLCAECLESIVLPETLLLNRRYRWTMSMVVESARILMNHPPTPAQTLLEQARKDFTKGSGANNEAIDFSILPHQPMEVKPISQDSLTSRATLTARLTGISTTHVDGATVQHWHLQLLPEAERVVLHAFVGAEVASSCRAQPGDIITCCGHLHASPDALEEEASPEQALPQRPLAPPRTALTEAAACRILCNAVCTHEWAEFAAAASDNLSYTSHMNGTKLSSKHAFIRYMSERRQLWRQQHSWQAMSWDTGTVIYRGEHRPCYMLSCYGKPVGASILSVQDHKISAIETLPETVNNSFTPDSDCSTKARFFHPFRGHLTPHPAEHTPLQLFAASYLRECMVRHTGYCPPNSPESVLPSSNARWVKLMRDEPSPCDMAFTHGGRVFAVCAVEVASHPDNGENLSAIAAAMPGRDEFLSFSGQQGLLPCIFPAQRNYSPEPTHSWNLWDLRTLQPVQPQLMPAPDATPPPSHWEILTGALAELRTRIAHMGGTVIAYHDTPDIFPHFWYRDADEGKLSWIIVRCSTDPAKQDTSMSDEEMLPIQEAPEAAGYLVYATAYGDKDCSTPARRGEPIFLKLSELLPLNS